MPARPASRRPRPAGSASPPRSPPPSRSWPPPTPRSSRVRAWSWTAAGACTSLRREHEKDDGGHLPRTWPARTGRGVDRGADHPWRLPARRRARAGGPGARVRRQQDRDPRGAAGARGQGPGGLAAEARHVRPTAVGVEPARRGPAALAGPGEPGQHLPGEPRRGAGDRGAGRGQAGRAAAYRRRPRRAGGRAGRDGRRRPRRGRGHRGRPALPPRAAGLGAQRAAEQDGGRHRDRPPGPRRDRAPGRPLGRLGAGAPGAAGRGTGRRRRRGRDRHARPARPGQHRPRRPHGGRVKIIGLETFLVPPRWLFLRVDTDEGVSGWGEPVVEGRADTVRAAVNELADHLVGSDPLRIEDTWQVLTKGGFYRGGPVLSSAVAGIDQALWDIAGKVRGVPVHELLGGPVRDRVRVYAWIGGDDPAEVADLASAQVEAGFTAVKMNGSGAMAPVDS